MLASSSKIIKHALLAHSLAAIILSVVNSKIELKDIERETKLIQRTVITRHINAELNERSKLRMSV
jgi:hypothetical protein